MPRKSELLEELTLHIGYAETIELLRSWGGRRIWVPKSVGHDDPIALKIGYPAALALCHFYGGSEIDLPAERNAIMETRNRCVVHDLQKGDTTRAVGIRYGISPRHARHIRKQYEARRSFQNRRSTDPGYVPPAQ